MLSPTTLYIKHFPSELSALDREELLKLVGAIRVKVMPDNGKMRFTAFALFSSHEEAKHALNLLHQKEILGQRLLVEFSKPQHEGMLPLMMDFPKMESLESKEVNTKPSDRETLKKSMEDFSKKLHGVAPVLGLEYLPSPMVKYKYPAPTPTIIQNISHALVSVPKFYTQVLHLMNRMNLPAPFGPLTPAPPMAEDIPVIDQVDIVRSEDMDVTSSEDESEFESEDDGEKKLDKIFPQKRPLSRPKIKKKRQKLSSLVPVLTAAGTRPKTEASDVFETQFISQKKINVKSIDQIHTGPTVKDESVGKFGEIEPTAMPERDDDEISEPGEEIWRDSKFVSLDELRRKRLSSREMKTMSIYKNYSPGEPTFRLYIKNLAKHVEEDDLRYVFGRFINRRSEQDRNMFDVRLMKEGRMKGQAFVTLANEKQAIDAVRETNGYIFCTKPLVVQFARSAKPKEDDKKGKKN